MTQAEDIQFAIEMVTTLRDRIRKGAGFTEINIYGQTVKMTDLKADLAYWQKQLRQLQYPNSGGSVRPLDLSTL